jgi:hypothetical protein
MHMIALKIGVSLSVIRFSVFYTRCFVSNGRPFFIHESLNDSRGSRTRTYAVPILKSRRSRKITRLKKASLLENSYEIENLKFWESLTKHCLCVTAIVTEKVKRFILIRGIFIRYTT